VAEEQITVPASFRLEQNYPNPFNPETVIRYQIPETGSAVLVDLRIYNLLGDEIARLVHASQSAGSYQVLWNGKDRRGRNVAAGTYLYRLTAGHFEETRKMLILR
jgi:flagellar hook assembly protein FlgD